MWTRFTPLAVQTTALTEGTTPTVIDMTAANVSTTVAEYGGYVTVTTLFSLTGLDSGLKEHIEVLAQNAGETIDTLIQTELMSGATAQIVSGKALTAVAATDTMSSTEIKKAVRTLKQNKARTFENGMFRGILNVSQVYDLRGDSTWLSAQIYTDSSKVKNGQIGALHGVDFMETNNEATTSSTVTVHSAFIFGKNAYGTVRLSNGSEGTGVIVKTPGAQDTSNPMNMYSTVAWKLEFACKVLNGNWVLELMTGVSA